MLSNATAAYDAYCEATHPSDACPICGIDCRCDGPHELDDSAISTASAAAPLSQLTAAIGRTDDRDVEVVEVACTNASHERSKNTESIWRTFKALKADPSGEMEYRNCPCGSTLARPIVTAFYLGPTHIRYVTADGDHHIVELLPGRTDTCPDWLLTADDRHALFAGYETLDDALAISDAAHDARTEAA